MSVNQGKLRDSVPRVNLLKRRLLGGCNRWVDHATQ